MVESLTDEFIVPRFRRGLQAFGLSGNRFCRRGSPHIVMPHPSLTGPRQCVGRGPSTRRPRLVLHFVRRLPINRTESLWRGAFYDLILPSLSKAASTPDSKTLRTRPKCRSRKDISNPVKGRPCALLRVAV